MKALAPRIGRGLAPCVIVETAAGETLLPGSSGDKVTSLASQLRPEAQREAALRVRRS
jgi:hypothetical protein